MDTISTKFYSHNRSDWEGMNPPSLFKFYTNTHGRLLENPSSLSPLYSISFYVLNFFVNLHNRILASGQHGDFRLFEVILLGVASTVTVPLIALAETIIRLLPALGLYVYYRYLTDEAVKDDSFTHRFVLGAYVGAILIIEGARSGYPMIFNPGPYFAYNRVDDWIPDE